MFRREPGRFAYDHEFVVEWIPWGTRFLVKPPDGFLFSADTHVLQRSPLRLYSQADTWKTVNHRGFSGDVSRYQSRGNRGEEVEPYVPPVSNLPTPSRVVSQPVQRAQQILLPRVTRVAPAVKPKETFPVLEVKKGRQKKNSTANQSSIRHQEQFMYQAPRLDFDLIQPMKRSRSHIDDSLDLAYEVSYDSANSSPSPPAISRSVAPISWSDQVTPSARLPGIVTVADICRDVGNSYFTAPEVAKRLGVDRSKVNGALYSAAGHNVFFFGDNGRGGEGAVWRLRRPNDSWRSPKGAFDSKV